MSPYGDAELRGQQLVGPLGGIWREETIDLQQLRPMGPEHRAHCITAHLFVHRIPGVLAEVRSHVCRLEDVVRLPQPLGVVRKDAREGHPENDLHENHEGEGNIGVVQVRHRHELPVEVDSLAPPPHRHVAVQQRELHVEVHQSELPAHLPKTPQAAPRPLRRLLRHALPHVTDHHVVPVKRLAHLAPLVLVLGSDDKVLHSPEHVLVLLAQRLLRLLGCDLHRPWALDPQQNGPVLARGAALLVETHRPPRPVQPHLRKHGFPHQLKSVESVVQILPLLLVLQHARLRAAAPLHGGDLVPQFVLLPPQLRQRPGGHSPPNLQGTCRPPLHRQDLRGAQQHLDRLARPQSEVTPGGRRLELGHPLRRGRGVELKRQIRVGFLLLVSRRP
mmetsp:Transcript_27521/g.88298  ORF Transcript_27521/g.88298 Transcript_27521/m.88298 type:complete len:389 (+) Transcript_27521:54-1220(+)